YTQKQARALGAELNIKEGQGTVEDYVRYFREAQLDEATAQRRGMLAREKGKQGYTIGDLASEDLYHAFLSKKVSAAKAEAIADVGRDNDTLQLLGLKHAGKQTADELRESLKF